MLVQIAKMMEYNLLEWKKHHHLTAPPSLLLLILPITCTYSFCWSRCPPTCLSVLVQPPSLPLSMHFALIRREHRQTVLSALPWQGCCRGRETTLAALPG